MNKQKRRYTKGMPREYKMPLDEFCMLYGIDLKVIMHRLNITCWEDYDALIVPTSLMDTKPHTIRRALNLLDMGWKDDQIARRLAIPEEHIDIIRGLSDYEKEIYSNANGKYFKDYFFLNPAAIDVSKIFHAVDPDNMVVGV